MILIVLLDILIYVCFSTALEIPYTPSPYPCVGSACTLPGHDPSAMQRTADGYFVTLTTGSGNGDAFGMKYLDPNDYSAGWHQGEYSYHIPPWAADYYPWKNVTRYKCGYSKTSTNCPFWGPDLPSNGNGFKPGGDKFIMYYSLPAFQLNWAGCIGVATGTFNAPRARKAASINWIDAGSPVLCSTDAGMKVGGGHDIDPSVMMDKNQRKWLTYGSFSEDGSAGGGIWLVELNATTGMLSDHVLKECGNAYPYCWSKSSPFFYNIANHPYNGENSIEASYMYNYPEGDYYYLFVNYYGCCAGISSTYEIRVGRAIHPTATFYDRKGISMPKGGGTLVLQNKVKSASHTFVGPGHAGILYDEATETYVFSFDYQAVDTNENVYVTESRIMKWDKDGWPVITDTNWVGPV